uniref:Uncharacterized protein n=1 Tax=Ascaris lumbricoides TaxID=6252 RepID=A0A0M3HF71_ASCLU
MEGTHKFIASAHSRKCASNASEPVGAPTVAVHPASDDILTAKAQRDPVRNMRTLKDPELRIEDYGGDYADAANENVLALFGQSATTDSPNHDAGNTVTESIAVVMDSSSDCAVSGISCYHEGWKDGIGGEYHGDHIPEMDISSDPLEYSLDPPDKNSCSSYSI